MGSADSSSDEKLFDDGEFCLINLGISFKYVIVDFYQIILYCDSCSLVSDAYDEPVRAYFIFLPLGRFFFFIQKCLKNAFIRYLRIVMVRR